MGNSTKSRPHNAQSRLADHPLSPNSNSRAQYNLSFTAASIRPDLARIVAESYLAAGDWDIAKERVLSTNALQCRTSGGGERQERELRLRLMRLTQEQLMLLAHSTAEDRAAISWLAAVKHISFAFDFAAEVLREKLAAFDPVLRPSDYEGYVDVKSAIHPEFTRLSSVSKSKVRQVLLRMLREAGLLAAGAGLGTIQRPVLSPSVVRVVTAENPRWLAGFLVPDTEF